MLKELETFISENHENQSCYWGNFLLESCGTLPETVINILWTYEKLHFKRESYRFIQKLTILKYFLSKNIYLVQSDDDFEEISPKLSKKNKKRLIQNSSLGQLSGDEENDDLIAKMAKKNKKRLERAKEIERDRQMYSQRACVVEMLRCKLWQLISLIFSFSFQRIFF